jgi:hypothetical protein
MCIEGKFDEQGAGSAPPPGVRATAGRRWPAGNGRERVPAGRIGRCGDSGGQE